MSKFPKWSVTRQHYYYTGELVVEIQDGGIDYAGPDMLVSRYKGDTDEFNDPIEAAERAIEIRKLWQADEEQDVHIGWRGMIWGYFGGELTDEDYKTDEEILAKAQEIFDNLPKCDICDRPLPEDYYILYDFGEDFGKFCSDRCAEDAEYLYYTMEEEEDAQV